MGGKKRGVRNKKSSGRLLPLPSPVTEEPPGDVPYLPMELWTGILIRTPAEDLVRFKGVCKAWHELIGSRSFAESHLEHWRSRPASRIFFDVESPKDYNSDIFYSRGSITRPDCRKGHYRVRCHSLLTSFRRAELGCGSKDCHVLASCDGLILICYEEETHYQLLICNPVTGSYKELPVFQPTGIHYTWPNYEWTMVLTGSGQYKVCGMERCGIEKWDAPRECYILELQIGTKEQPEWQWKELMTPLSDEWYIGAATTKDGKVHWLATKLTGQADDKYYTIKVLSLDISKEEFSASVSIESRLCEKECRPEDCFFPWKGSFFYRRKAHREDKSMPSSLWVLEDFDTMTWTEYGNFRLSYYDFLYSPGQCPVIRDSKLPLGSFYDIYVFELTSKKFMSLEIDSSGWPGRIHVHHTDSLIGCN